MEPLLSAGNPQMDPYAGTFQEPANLPKTHQAARAMVAMKCQKDMYVKHFCKDIGFLKCSTNHKHIAQEDTATCKALARRFRRVTRLLEYDLTERLACPMPLPFKPLPEWNLTVNNHIVKLFCENLVCWNQFSLEFSLWPPSTKDVCNKSCIRFG